LIGRAASLLIGVLLLGACVNDATRLRVSENSFLSSVDSDDPGLKRLAAFFDEAVFGRDDALKSSKVRSFDRVLSRWVVPIRVTVGGDVTDNAERKIRDRLEHFAGLTGTELIWQGRNAKRYNFKITLIDSSQIRAEASVDTICFARPTDSYGKIISAVVFLPSNDAEDFEDCIDHELMHAFGFDGHSHRLNSALSYMHKQSRLTAWDEIMLRTLYDSRLSAGLPRNDAWPIVWELLSQGVARQRTAGALPELGEEFWAVFPDEIPFSLGYDSLPDLPRLAMAHHIHDGRTVETRAVFATRTNSERAEIFHAEADDPVERWDSYRPRWRRVSKGGNLTDKPNELDDLPYRGLYDTIWNGSRHCLVFVREAEIPGRFFSGYYCRTGAISGSMRRKFLDALSTSPPEPAES
jgi:hypothetical protein